MWRDAVARYTDKDIYDMAFGRFAFTPAQIKNVYTNLINGCRNVLHSFHSAYSKDEKELIQDLKLSRRKRLAAQMRMEDKVLVEGAIKAAKKAMDKLIVRLPCDACARYHFNQCGAG